MDPKKRPPPPRRGRSRGRFRGRGRLRGRGRGVRGRGSPRRGRPMRRRGRPVRRPPRGTRIRSRGRGRVNAKPKTTAVEKPFALKTVVPPPEPKKKTLKNFYSRKKKERPAIVKAKTDKRAMYSGKRASSGLTKDNLLLEFIQTEDEYVTHLESLKKYIIDGLTRMKRNKERVISDVLFVKIFGEFEVILKINLLFVRDLKKIEKQKKENLIPFCEVVINFSQCFKLYSTYMGKYFEVVCLAREEIKRNSKFKDFLKICEVYFREKGFRITDFFSYLILPIQRIPRYKLLLENLLKVLRKTSDSGGPEFGREKKKLEQALENISLIADYCERQQKQRKLQDKMGELAKILNVRDLIQPHRHLLAEYLSLQCYVEEKFDNKRVRCNLYVFNDIFACLVTESRKNSTIALVLKDELTIEKVKVQEDMKKRKGPKLNYAIRIKTYEDNNFCLKIFFDTDKKRTEVKEMLMRQIEEMAKSTLKLDIQIQRKAKKGPAVDIFASATSHGAGRFIDAFEIFTE